MNKGKEKFSEFQNLNIPNSNGNLCDLSNDLLGKETAGFGQKSRLLKMASLPMVLKVS